MSPTGMDTPDLWSYLFGTVQDSTAFLKSLCQDMEDWVRQCVGYGCRKGLKPESPNQETDYLGRSRPSE